MSKLKSFSEIVKKGLLPDVGEENSNMIVEKVEGYLAKGLSEAEIVDKLKKDPEIIALPETMMVGIGIGVGVAAGVYSGPLE